MAQIIHQWSVTPAPCNCIFCKLAGDGASKHEDTPPVQFRLAEDIDNHRFLVEELGKDAVGHPTWASVPKERAAVALAEAVKQLLAEAVKQLLAEAVKQLLAPKSPIEEQLSQEATI